MKVGQIYLDKTSGDRAQQFQSIIESLDRLAIEQHVLVASPELARRLGGLPYVAVGPVVSTPVMAYCLMPEIDVAHAHDPRAGQVGLLLTLTRSTPYVLSAGDSQHGSRNPLHASIRERARQSIDTEVLRADELIAAYRGAIAALAKRPEHSDRRQ